MAGIRSEEKTPNPPWETTRSRILETGQGESEREWIRLLEFVLADASEAVVITEAEVIDAPHGPRIVFVNPAFTRLTGYIPADILGKTPRLLQGAETSPQTRRFMREKLLARQSFRTEILNYRKDGSPFWAEIRVQPVSSESGQCTHWISVQRETTQRPGPEPGREAERDRILAEALDRADRDSLTGLLNHRAFHERLTQESRKARETGQPLAILALDLDNFKFFNEAYGHLAGDQVLRRVADALGKSCRSPGDVLARLGGDEFGLLLPGQTRAAGNRLIARLRERLQRVGYHPPESDAPIPLTVSCGVASLPEDGLSALSVLEIADKRLRQNKQGEPSDESRQVRELLTQTIGGFGMLDALVTAVDSKDRYTRRHSEDVMRHSDAIARRMQLPENERRLLQVAALLHDVGKIGTPDRILRLPGRLRDGEYEVIKQHAALGALLVRAVPDLAETGDAVHFHHERWDGGGYPHGLKGEQIPVAARILAVADGYSAMTTDRPYRKGLTPAAARALLLRDAEQKADTSRQWDPRCVRALLDSFERSI